MYAQSIEGDHWIGEKMDKGKIDKMSGEHMFCFRGFGNLLIAFKNRPATRANVRAHASYSETRT